MYAHYLRTRHVAAVPAATDVNLDNRGSALWKTASGCSGFLMLWNTGLTALMVGLAGQVLHIPLVSQYAWVSIYLASLPASSW